MPTPPPTMFNRFRRRRTCNAQGLVGLDVLLARCHRTCQPPRRALDVVVVPAVERLCRFFSTYSDRFQRPKKSKIDVKCAEVRAGALDFPRALPIAKSLQIDAKCAEVRASHSR
ncbi:hypothetical protein EV121DRAFT_297739 [Schizophyllum commune]